MSYISTEGINVADFNQGVISLWFRVPQASIDAAQAAFVPGTDTGDFFVPNLSPPAPVQLNGVIPLVTFGPIFTSYTTHAVIKTWGSYTTRTHLYTGFCNDTILDVHTFPIETVPQVFKENYQLDQSYIGVDCMATNPDTGDPQVALCLRLQTGGYADMANMANKVVAFTQTDQDILFPVSDPYTIDGDYCSGLGNKPCTDPPPLFGESINVFLGKPFNQTVTNEDDTDTIKLRAQEFFWGTSPTITITPDVWHHILVSFDLSGSVDAAGDETSLTSTCRLWVALDDENHNGASLPSHAWPSTVTPDDPNAVITANAWNTWAAETTAATQVINYVSALGYWGTDSSTSPGGRASYSLEAPTLPVSGHPMGLPAAAKMVDHILNIETAEFQMFTGISVDTSDDSVRRYFIDADGKPVPANQKANANNSHQSGSIEGLGQQPDVLLHGSSNWKQGKNTGSAGSTVDAKTGATIVDPGGQFTPTALITTYNPGPSLNGPQGP